MKARQIELDILSENFDQTLGKYKPESLKPLVKPPTPTLEPVVGASLVDLWESYIDFKRGSLSPSTLAKDVKRVRICINVHLPVKTLDKAVAIRDWLIAKLDRDDCATNPGLIQDCKEYSDY